MVKALKSREKPTTFDIHDLYPDSSDSQIAEKLATHFNAISSEFRGLMPDDVPQARSVPLRVLSRSEVAKRLREIKKPKSTVKGDIFPTLLTNASDHLVAPPVHIYNEITTTGMWPQGWKMDPRRLPLSLPTTSGISLAP